MSKRDITTVCTLAAHLALEAQKDDTGYIHGKPPPDAASLAAKDAMCLQRLANTLRTNFRSIVKWGTYLARMVEKAEAILKPYGLVGELSAAGITILGLPGNTGGGEGFQI